MSNEKNWPPTPGSAFAPPLAYSSPSMSTLMAQIRDFYHETQTPYPLPYGPHWPTLSRATARQAFLQEEVDELKEAQIAGDLAKVADALVDIIYITLGTAIEFGLPLDEIWPVVHAANMRKVGPEGVKKRADGKVIKPEGWVGPEAEIETIIRNALKKSGRSL